jgi:hypothetical protein
MLNISNCHIQLPHCGFFFISPQVIAQNERKKTKHFLRAPGAFLTLHAPEFQLQERNETKLSSTDSIFGGSERADPPGVVNSHQKEEALRRHSEHSPDWEMEGGKCN